MAGVRLVPPLGGVGSRPTRVAVTAEVIGRRTGVRIPDVHAEVDVDGDGTITLPRILTRKLSITVLDDSDVATFDSATGGSRPMPVEVGEVELIGGPTVAWDATRTERLGCQDGPTVTIGGVEHGTRLEVSAAALVSGATVPALVCGDVRLPAGDARVTMPATFEWQARGLLLASTSGDLDEALGARGAGAPARLRSRPTSWDAGTTSDPIVLDVGVRAEDRTLALALPTGSGWQAEGDGERLEPVAVDGWARVGRAGRDRRGDGALLARCSMWAGPRWRASIGWAAVVLVLGRAWRRVGAPGDPPATLVAIDDPGGSDRRRQAGPLDRGPLDPGVRRCRQRERKTQRPDQPADEVRHRTVGIVDLSSRITMIGRCQR